MAVYVNRHLRYIVTCHSSRHHVYLRGVRFQHAVQFLFGSGVSSKVDCSVGSKRQNGRYMLHQYKAKQVIYAMFLCFSATIISPSQLCASRSDVAY